MNIQTDFEKFLAEKKSHINESTDNDYMLPQHLKSIKEKAEELLELINDHKELDSWVESHIIEAATKIDEVYEFIKNGEKGE